MIPALTITTIVAVAAASGWLRVRSVLRRDPVLHLTAPAAENPVSDRKQIPVPS
jgi:hypothetical protein